MLAVVIGIVVLAISISALWVLGLLTSIALEFFFHEDTTQIPFLMLGLGAASIVVLCFVISYLIGNEFLKLLIHT